MPQPVPTNTPQSAPAQQAYPAGLPSGITLDPTPVEQDTPVSQLGAVLASSRQQSANGNAMNGPAEEASAALPAGVTLDANPVQQDTPADQLQRQKQQQTNYPRYQPIVKKEGYLSGLYESTLKPLVGGAIQSAKQKAAEEEQFHKAMGEAWKRHDWGTMAELALKQIGKGAVQGAEMNPAVSSLISSGGHLVQAGKSLANGDVGSTVENAAEAVPILGPMAEAPGKALGTAIGENIDKPESEMDKGKIAGAATGAILTAASPLAGEAVSGMRNAISEGAATGAENAAAANAEAQGVAPKIATEAPKGTPVEQAVQSAVAKAKNVSEGTTPIPQEQLDTLKQTVQSETEQRLQRIRAEREQAAKQAKSDLDQVLQKHQATKEQTAQQIQKELDQKLQTNVENKAAADQAIQQKLHQGIRDAMNQVAHDNGVEPPKQGGSIRDVTKQTADNVKAQARQQYQMIDEAMTPEGEQSEGRFQRFQDKLDNLNDAIRENIGIDDAKVEKLQSQKADVEKEMNTMLEQATAAGVDQDFIDATVRQYRTSQALYDLDAEIKASTSGSRPGIGTGRNPEIVDPDKLFNRVNKLYDSGRLKAAVGSDLADELMGYADEAQVASREADTAHEQGNFAARRAASEARAANVRATREAVRGARQASKEASVQSETNAQAAEDAAQKYADEQIKRIEQSGPSMPTGKQALAELIRKHTAEKSRLVGNSKAVTDWQAVQKEFGDLDSASVRSLYGDEAEAVRDYVNKNARMQKRFGYAAKAAKWVGLSSVGYEVGKELF